MSDIRIHNLKTNQNVEKTKYSKLDIQAIIESISKDALGIDILKSNYKINEGTNEVISSLGLDENYNLVIIEYRFGKFGQVINKGLIYIDYIKEHQSFFKLLVKEIKGEEIAKQVNYNSRLVVIGDDFNKFDDYAIKQMPFPIELIKFQIFNKDYCLFEKIYQSKNIVKLFNNNIFDNKLYKAISDFTLSLGDEVIEYCYNGFIAYRKIKNFMYITFDNNVNCSILQNNQYKTYKVKCEKDLDKIYNFIERSYDEN